MPRRRSSAWLVAFALTLASVVACGRAGAGGKPAARQGAAPRRSHEHVAHVRKRRSSPPPVALPRRYGPPGHDRVPILMYHLIAAAKPGATYPDLWTPPEAFAAQMRALHRAGYRAVTLTDVVDHWSRGLILPRRPVVVTFDDGYTSQYRNAARTLRRLRWPGVLFLEVHNMTVAGGLPPRDVRRMLAAGWELGSHTVTHPDLTTLGPTSLRRELVQSRRILRRTFGVPVRSFCYPAGRYDATVEAATRAAGYRAATTEVPGIAGPTDDRLALPRIRVSGATAPQTLLAELRGSG